MHHDARTKDITDRTSGSRDGHFKAKGDMAIDSAWGMVMEREPDTANCHCEGHAYYFRSMEDRDEFAVDPGEFFSA
jgi:YHS domain-containing protein